MTNASRVVLGVSALAATAMLVALVAVPMGASRVQSDRDSVVLPGPVGQSAVMLDGESGTVLGPPWYSDPPPMIQTIVEAQPVYFFEHQLRFRGTSMVGQVANLVSQYRFDIVRPGKFRLSLAAVMDELPSTGWAFLGVRVNSERVGTVAFPPGSAGIVGHRELNVSLLPDDAVTVVGWTRGGVARLATAALTLERTD